MRKIPPREISLKFYLTKGKEPEMSLCVNQNLTILHFKRMLSLNLSNVIPHL